MGQYLNQTGRGPMGASFNCKCQALIEDGAKPITEPKEWSEGLVCCMNNGAFGAAGYAYNENEMNVFKHGYGGRSYQWFRYPEANKYAQ